MREHRRVVLVVLAALCAGALALCAAWLRSGPTAPGESPSEVDLGEETERSLGEWLGDGPAAGLVESSSDGAEKTSGMSELGLVDEASRELEECRQRGDCIVARAGYLDLTGKVWGCVLQGEDWVEVRLVSERADGACDVACWHMDADDVRAAL